MSKKKGMKYAPQQWCVCVCMWSFIAAPLPADAAGNAVKDEKRTPEQRGWVCYFPKENPVPFARPLTSTVILLIYRTK